MFKFGNPRTGKLERCYLPSWIDFTQAIHDIVDAGKSVFEFLVVFEWGSENEIWDVVYQSRTLGKRLKTTAGDWD